MDSNSAFPITKNTRVIIFSKRKSLSENLKINNVTLSNFYLVLLLLDTPDEEIDLYLSERVMTVRYKYAISILYK